MSRLGPRDECRRCGYSQVKASEHNDRMFARFGRYRNYMDELRPLSVCPRCRRVVCGACTTEQPGARVCLQCALRRHAQKATNAKAAP